jgi:hypothetical protein
MNRTDLAHDLVHTWKHHDTVATFYGRGVNDSLLKTFRFSLERGCPLSSLYRKVMTGNTNLQGFRVLDSAVFA